MRDLPAPPATATPVAAPRLLPRAATGEETMRGLLIAALAFAVISAADAAVKWALPEVGPGGAMIWRGIIGTAAVLLLVPGRGGCGWRGLVPVNRPLLAARCLLHCCISAAWFLAWMLGVGLADSYAVAAVCPLLMTLLAIPMLGEGVGWRRMLSTAVGFAGVLVMLQPGGELWRWETAMLLAATCGMAVTRIWTRTLSLTDRPTTIAFWLMACHIPAGLAVCLIPGMAPPGGLGLAGLTPSWAGFLALLLFGVANAAAHVMFARAYALAPVAAIAPFEYTPLLWGVLLGFVIWAEVPAWATLAGAAVVIAAGLYNLHREHLRRTRERAAAAAAGKT